MAVPKPSRTKVFISYSHRDAEWLRRLRVHLRPFEREHDIEIWDDTKIRPGSKWREEIQKAVESAKVAVLLISADFLASDFISTNELPPLLNSAEQDGAVILSLILSPSRFLKSRDLSQFQSVNDPSNPLINMTKGDQEAVLVKLTECIETSLDTSPLPKPRKSAEEITSQKEEAEAAVGRAVTHRKQDEENNGGIGARSELKGQVAPIGAETRRRTSVSSIVRRPFIFIPVILLALAIALVAFKDKLTGGAAPKLTESNEALGWYARGVDALRQGMYDIAEDTLKRAVDADNNFVLAHARLAEAYIDMDYYKKAKDELWVIRDHSNLPPLQALYIQASTDTVDRKFENAIESYQEITRRAPKEDKPYAYVDLGRGYERNENADKAIENYLEAARLNPGYAAAHLRLGVLYGRKQNIDGR